MQDILVILIGIAVFGLVAYRFYKLLTRKPAESSKCSGCSGCALKVDVECASTNR